MTEYALRDSLTHELITYVTSDEDPPARQSRPFPLVTLTRHLPNLDDRQIANWRSAWATAEEVCQMLDPLLQLVEYVERRTYIADRHRQPLVARPGQWLQWLVRDEQAARLGQFKPHDEMDSWDDGLPAWASDNGSGGRPR